MLAPRWGGRALPLAWRGEETEGPIGFAVQKGLNRAEFCGGSNSCEDGAMTKRTPPFSPEVRERAVRMVLEHQGEHSSPYAAIRSIAAKIGCSGETLRNWVRQAE